MNTIQHAAPVIVEHARLGKVLITVECLVMQAAHPFKDITFVECDGRIIEVTRSLLALPN